MRAALLALAAALVACSGADGPATFDDETADACDAITSDSGPGTTPPPPDADPTCPCDKPIRCSGRCSARDYDLGWP